MDSCLLAQILHAKSNVVTRKRDGYSVGMLVLMLFTGETDAIKFDLELGERNNMQDH